MTGNTVVIACVQNEADIIEAFVRHTLLFADRMILVLHRSIDNTEDILRLLRQEGLPIEIRWLESSAYDQPEVMNALLREAQNDPGIARIMPLDVDEFLLTTNGGPVRAAIEALPEDAPIRTSMRMYAPPADATSIHGGVASCPWRVRGDPFPPMKTIVIPSALLGGNLSKGNHRYRQGGVPDDHVATTITIAHFPIRSLSQLQAKALCWIRESLHRCREDNDCFHWRAMFADLLASRLETPADARRWALQYAEYVVPGSSNDILQDPLRLPVVRYPHLAIRVSPLAIGRQLALELGLSVTTDTSLIGIARMLEQAARERVLTAGQGTATVTATHATHVRHDRQEAIGG